MVERMTYRECAPVDCLLLRIIYRDSQTTRKLLLGLVLCCRTHYVIFQYIQAVRCEHQNDSASIWVDKHEDVLDSGMLIPAHDAC